MEMRIKREETRRSITVLFVTLNKKTHTVSAHCALSTEHSECTQHSVHNTSLALKCTEHSVLSASIVCGPGSSTYYSPSHPR